MADLIAELRGFIGLGFSNVGPLELVKTNSNLPTQPVRSDLLKRIRDLLPQSQQAVRLEDVKLFALRKKEDPVLAVRIGNQWYEIYRWE